ncbi:VCBS domain-containing protein [Shewanella sp. 5_MG-2023]|uniref:VCBS domain-containing protein n=1 Tax=Shewanella sp. 5_MG-2023 TaxID=3062656 RepID=UPI0026E1788F|nr:VCBS domain-containing protein [Shewanella sp. 5_MG-2023]MDO6641864.1 VCBS domain-containing protein [Shewanella sp. 5_MG-2023]
MNNKSFIPLIIATGLLGCGGDDGAELNGNTRGSIAITGSNFIAGETISAAATDADGIIADTLTYVWSTGVIGTSITITEADEGSVISVSANYTDEAGFTEGVGASTPTINPTLNVSASIIKGPIDGATCDIFEVDDSGAAVLPAQAAATSDVSGGVTFSDVHFEGTGLIACTGGTYTDESTGLTLDAPQLRSVVNVVENIVETDAAGLETILPPPTYVVSPLTEMAVQNAGSDLNQFADEAKIINARFGIRFDTTEVLPTLVGTVELGADGAEDADRYGSVLALLSQVDADNADADLSTVMQDLASDVADGSFSEESLVTLETAQINLQTTSQVADSVDEALLDVIGASVGYNNDPVAAIIEGELGGTVQHTATLPLTGSLTIIDPNFQEDAFVAQTDVALDYGTFSISADGSWSYTVNTANETVASLELGNSVRDSITIASIDGTTAYIDIRVASLTQVVKISDTGGDTGELRFSVDNLRQGKLSASFTKEVALGSDGNIKDAYITLYGSSGSSSESLIDLRIQGEQSTLNEDGSETTIDPRFFVRNTDSDAYPGNLITAPFVEEQFYDVEITWDLDATEQITVTIDGEVIGGGSFSTAAVVDSDYTGLDQWFADGVKAIQFRFGDNDRTIPFGSFYVDNIEVFSDTAGTTSIFSDDFEGYDAGETLDGTDSKYGLAIYSEVIVFDAGDGTVEPTPAVFFDLTGRIASNEATATGAVSVLDPDVGEDSIVQTTLMGAYGTLSILDDGSWTYTLDTTDATIAALVVGESELDTFTIESFDGTTAELVITITGTVVVATGDNNVARMADTSTDADAELRLTTDPLAEGSISTTLKLQAIAGFTATDGVSEDNTAYISVYGGSASSGNLTGEIVFTNDGTVKYRDANKDQQIIDGLTYTDDTDIDVVLEWTATGYSVSIDGGTTFYGPYVAINTGSATQTYQIRIGSSSKESAKELLADDIVIADDTGSAVLSEDFEIFAEGEDLSTTYSSSAEATVMTIAGSSVNKVARMADTTTDADAELRLTTDPLAEGSISTTLKLQAIAGFTATDGVSEDNTAYISVYGGSASSGNLTGEIVLSNDGSVKYRDANKDQQIIDGLTYTDDTDINVVLEWTATGYSVSIDGGTTFYGPYVAINTGSATETYQIRIGSSSKESAKELLADDIVIDDATDTAVLSEDFESYAVGDDLSTIYSSSAEATVQ